MFNFALCTLDIDDQVTTLLPPIYYTLLVSGISSGLHLMPLTDNVENISTRIIHTAGVLIWVFGVSSLDLASTGYPTPNSVVEQWMR